MIDYYSKHSLCLHNFIIKAAQSKKRFLRIQKHKVSTERQELVFPLGVAFAKQIDLDEVIESSSEATVSWVSNHR